MILIIEERLEISFQEHFRKIAKAERVLKDIKEMIKNPETKHQEKLEILQDLVKAAKAETEMLQKLGRLPQEE